ncbi:MAG: large subunit ribosomal protein L21 [Parcubacteria group bacterium Gr01-1014_38]|nr:MAG: large subunit ribosomal protein L21 [Parcubacteria group bacterium Gr01-1014_38]
MSDVLAVIATGGKQVLVRPGDTMRVEKLDGEPSAAVTFPEVLLLARGEEVRVGHPTVPGAVVTGTIAKHGRHDKVIGIKFKAKKRYRKKFGHRQHYTEVKIGEINF